MLNKLKIKLQMQEFACVCAHFRPIKGTFESAHFIQLSNLIKLLRIISPKKSFGDHKELAIAFQKEDFQSINLRST